MLDSIPSTLGQQTAVCARPTLAGTRTPGLLSRRGEGLEMDWKERKSEYSAKLRDPRWQKMRLDILNRDEWMCRRCFDSQSTLHVHHRWYESGKEPWEYNPQALVTLCETCHSEETETLRDMTADLVLITKQCGALSRQFYDLSSALSGSVNTPLDEYEWSVLTWAIGQLLFDRHDGQVSWNRAREEYKVWCAEESAKKIAKGSAA